MLGYGQPLLLSAISLWARLPFLLMGTPEFTPVYSLDNKGVIAGNVYENCVPL